MFFWKGRGGWARTSFRTVHPPSPHPWKLAAKQLHKFSTFADPTEALVLQHHLPNKGARTCFLFTCTAIHRPQVCDRKEAAAARLLLEAALRAKDEGVQWDEARLAQWFSSKVGVG